MVSFITKYKYQTILWFFIFAYIAYFSFFTILRYRTLYSSYFDLGIMHQTVYNTYKGIVTGDLGRIMEMTDTVRLSQIKRMAIHNDLLLALLAPFYFIYSGPETLLIIQSIILGLGAWALYKIVLYVFSDQKRKEIIALVFAFAYLMYTPMQRANIFDFHAVTLTTSFMLFMFYFWLVKRYRVAFLFFILSLITKEQVSLTLFFFGLYGFFVQKKEKRSILFSLMISGISIVWFFLSMKVIIPYFRGSLHFALKYYEDFGNSSIDILIGFMKSPQSMGKYLFRWDTLRYFHFLLGPLGFLSLLSPLYLAIALPEFMINLFSNSWNMRNIIFHYTSVIQPFVFVSAVYGMLNITKLKITTPHFAFRFAQATRGKQNSKLIPMLLVGTTLLFSYFKGPLPFAKEQEVHPFLYPQKESADAMFWANALENDNLKISSTGQLAPFFSGRRYFYTFSAHYKQADYIILRLNEIYEYPEKDTLISVYEELKKDKTYERIYQRENFEVYKNIK